MFLDQDMLRSFNQQVRLTPNFKSILLEAADYFEQNLVLEDPDSIEELAGKINKRQMKSALKDARSEGAANHHWVFGEKKVFCWTLIFYSHFNDVALEDMHRASREEINRIFIRKHPIFIRYEMIRLLNKKMGRKIPWEEQEIALFRETVHKPREQNDWKAISFDLFLRSSGQIFKSPNQCREKWSNFLNPSLKREAWTLEEDLKLFQLIQRFGCRWAMISREFGESRTQHMVKNRVNLFYNNWKAKKKSSKKKGIFNSIYSYLKRRMNKPQKPSKWLHNRERAQYDCLHYNQSNEAGDLISEQSSHHFPLPLLEYKEEKRTLDEEQVNPMQDMLKTDESSRGLELEQSLQIFDLFCRDLNKTSRESQYGVQMRVIEEQVVRALGCNHFERLPNQQFLEEQVQEEESFCWL